MNDRLTQIGFNQRIHLEWVELTANLVLAGNDKTAVYSFLQELLKDKVSIGGQSVRGNREKVITILMKTWLAVPHGLNELRNEGLQLLKELPKKERIVVHWGMALAVYPFWGSVAAHTGRLLRLQGTAMAAHVQRRVKEQYGERETASRAARRVLRSFIDWGVLNETDTKGVYTQGNRYSIHDPKLIAWMVESSLHARVNGSAEITDLLDSPGMFPFQIAHVSAEHLASISPRLDIMRHGLDHNLVMLRELK